MAYKVVIMPPAKRRLDMYIYYTMETLGNKPAARAIAKYGYRKIKFSKHKFVMLYRIQDNSVIVDGMFHELEDYEGIFANEQRLQ